MVLKLNGVPLHKGAESRTLEALKSLIVREPATAGTPDLGEKVSNSGGREPHHLNREAQEWVEGTMRRISRCYGTG